MISVKTSLASVIAVALAILAYFISSAAFAVSFITLLPSVFVVITVLTLTIVSSIQNPAPAAQTKMDSTIPSSASSSTDSNSDTATLYVGNLAYKANEQIVQEYFENIGTVKSVRLVKDKRTGRRKGFGFIEISAGDENSFIEKLNESEFMERNIIVRPANEKQH